MWAPCELFNSVQSGPSIEHVDMGVVGSYLMVDMTCLNRIRPLTPRAMDIGVDSGDGCVFPFLRIDSGDLGAMWPSASFSLISWLLITQFGHNTYQIEAEYLSY